MIRTRHNWWAELAKRSQYVAGLPRPNDENYWDVNCNKPLNGDAYNLSNCSHHNDAIARWVDGLAKIGTSQQEIVKLLGVLTSRNTYGGFSELAAYGLLLEAKIPFEVQTPMDGKEILNPNGSDLDGKLTIGCPVYFDVKAFGLHERLVNRLNEKLSSDFSSNFVSIGGSGDVSVSEIQKLLYGKGYSLLQSELAKKQKATRSSLDIHLKPKRLVQFSESILNPYELAKNNCDYAFRFAKQFVRKEPFILIFVLHPWFAGNRLATNFASDTDIFTRSFARRTFMQFVTDTTKTCGLSRGKASKLLSGIMFLNGKRCPVPTLRLR